MKKILVIILIPFVFNSCRIENEDVYKYKWKYGSGYHLDDFIIFDEMFRIKNDTIYLKDEAKAIIVSIRKYDSEVVLKIKSLSNNEIGIYHAK